MPRTEEWQPIAERLGLSVSLVFLGQPTSQADYDFIRKFTDEIGPAPDQPGERDIIINEDPPRHIEAKASSSDSIAGEIYRSLDELVAAAKRDPGKLGWIREQLRRHLALPAHWSEEEMKKTIARLDIEAEQIAANTPEDNPLTRKLRTEAEKAAYQKIVPAADQGTGSATGKSQHKEGRA